MFELNLPKTEVKLANRKGQPSIWDLVRKKWLVLTPEEYVRQHYLFYLIHYLNYPLSMISVERGLDINRLAKRSDIVVYGKAGMPIILIECKAPQIKLTQHTLEQASGYNQKLRAEYLCVTNGLEHLYYHIDFAQSLYKSIPHLPTYQPEMVQ